MESQILSSIGETGFNPKHAVIWLEDQPEELQLWQSIFEELLLFAAKPRQSSGNACVKLYGFVEQCSKSTKPGLRSFAFAEDTALKLFNFFMEWNEQDSHRSMRLILDFLIHSISNNPTPETGASVKVAILNNTLSTITQQSSRPSVKSALVALDHLIQKKLVYLYSILERFREIHSLPPEDDALWNAFIAKIFAWMEQHHMCPVAGKLLVTIFTSPWYEDSDITHRPEAWHKFIFRGLESNLEYLEPIKHYIFVPLFKTDRPGALMYLNHLFSLQKLTKNGSGSWDLNSMLWLAMLEEGKKFGVVNEPGRESEQNSASAFYLQADVLESVLCHDSNEARSSAFSVLIASPSTTKPYTVEALELLKQHLPSFHEDAEPKMRYDVLGHSRNMLKRIQNTVESLRRGEERISKKTEKPGSSKVASKSAPSTSAEEAKNHVPEKQQNDTVTKMRATLRQHEDFISWYIGFLRSELAPTTSYQRHITALKAMGFIIQPVPPQGGGSSELKDLLVDATWFRLNLDLIMDPFDDVREVATSLMMSLSIESNKPDSQKQVGVVGKTTTEELRSFCHKADELARRTARADHSDGAARSFELLCRWSLTMSDRLQIPFKVLSSLEAKLSSAEQDLANAVLQAPLHGSFASLRYIWGSLWNTKFSEAELSLLDELQSRAVICCQRIWKAVRHVLCDDSPEGHLPEELEEVEGLDTKDLLSYSFRAIHESSNLMRTIANNARQSRSRGLLAPSKHNFEEIGRLTFDELSNLRHRGAFTTVSQTFTTCCQLVKCFPVDSKDGPSLLDEWYEGALACIHTQASTTRRSAGIPALIVGILSSHSDRPSFEEVIRNLQEIGRRPALVSETDGSNLPQVHALNCIKDIFKSSYLSKGAGPYLTDCLQLAVDSLRSELWAIRNCGLLLLRSLIDCLFGTSESKASIEGGWDGRTIKIPYHKFKALPSLIVNLLEMGQQSKGVLIGTQTAESVFPALDIIRRAGPPEEFRDKLYDIIAWYLGSHIWHVREIAARTLCSFLLRPGWLEAVTNLLVSSGSSANKLHGALLTLKFLLDRLAEVMPEQLRDQDIRAVYDLLVKLPSINPYIITCSEARAVCIEIINFLTRLNFSESPRETDLVTGLSGLSTDFGTSTGPSALLDIRLGQVTVQHVLQQSSTDMGTTLAHILTAALEGDINVACSILESMPTINSAKSDEARASQVDAYIQVCLATDAPEPRTIALENLSTLIDEMLCNKSGTVLGKIPTKEVVVQLWADLHRKPMSPSLSDAIIRASGPLLATIILRSDETARNDTERWLRAWGVMMTDAGIADRTFDARMAAVNAMTSFSASLNLAAEATPNPAHLPWLLALYDALNDDDDEIRAAAAAATTPILSNQRLVSVEAGKRLLHWLVSRYGALDEFRAHVACRMAGHTPPTPNTALLLADWVPAEAQLADAMRFDDALFVVEEQNLYVDEVREARRWRDVFLSLPTSPATPKATLEEWTLAGLRTLTRIARMEGGDGPLGWTSKPEVFAICARVLVSGAAIARGGAGADGVMGELRRFGDEGRVAGVNGLLLDMCVEGLDGR